MALKEGDDSSNDHLRKIPGLRDGQPGLVKHLEPLLELRDHQQIAWEKVMRKGYGVDDGFRIQPDSSPHQQDSSAIMARPGKPSANLQPVATRILRIQNHLRLMEVSHEQATCHRFSSQPYGAKDPHCGPANDVRLCP